MHRISWNFWSKIESVQKLVKQIVLHTGTMSIVHIDFLLPHLIKHHLPMWLCAKYPFVLTVTRKRPGTFSITAKLFKPDQTRMDSFYTILILNQNISTRFSHVPLSVRDSITPESQL